MFFNIDFDTGDAICGWLAPDNPSQLPKVLVRAAGRDDVLLEANVDRPDVRDLGLHSAVRVGFRISEEIVSGLANVDDLEILEADTLTPLYRRFRPQHHLERKLFIFDSSAMPQSAMIKGLTDRFALNYTNSERYSLETMIVLLNNSFSKSMFFCGRSSFSRYASFLEGGGFLRAALLREPVQELAERLLFLRVLAQPNARHLLPTFTSGLGPLVDFAQALEFDDPKALLNSFRHIDEPQRQALASPTVRMFGCNPDEHPSNSRVSLALDRLASLDVVGTRERFPLFKALLEQFLDCESFDIREITTFPAVQAVAESLSRLGIVLDLLEHDLMLYGYVEEAITAGLNGAGNLAARDTHTI